MFQLTIHRHLWNRPDDQWNSVLQADYHEYEDTLVYFPSFILAVELSGEVLSRFLEVHFVGHQYNIL